MSTSDSFLNLKLKSLCGFEEGRFHATFSDNSSLIVQSNNSKLNSRLKRRLFDIFLQQWRKNQNRA
jgi:hypothetical protein